MKKFNLYLMLAAFLPMLTSCEIVGGIFKAGMGIGIFVVVLIAALIIWLITRGRGKRNS